MPEKTQKPKKRVRRCFLCSLSVIGVSAAVGAGVDYVLPRTLCRPGEWHGPHTDHFDGTYFFNTPEPGVAEADYGAAPILRRLKDRLQRAEYPEVKLMRTPRSLLSEWMGVTGRSP